MQSVLKIALVGFGTVGQSVARILCGGTHPRLRLTHIANRDVERKKVDWVPADVVWTDQVSHVVESEADVVIEVIGGVDPAADWIQQFLRAGKSVVTANKQVIALRGAELMALAREQRRHVLFEAAVAGGIPVVRGVREGLAGDQLCRVCGILNGTCNYILTRMETAQVSFADALTEAQSLGYAEADPTADVDGADAQAKLAILSMVGLRRQIEATTIPLVSIRAIEPIDFIYARRLECTIRQVARAELVGGGRRVLASVMPALVPLASTLARIEGNQNVIVVEGAFGGETAFSGYGAGGDPTAVAVVSDLESIARGHEDAAADWRIDRAERVEHEFMAPHYARFIVADRPGIIAALADVFSRHGVNVDSVLQEPGWSKAELPFVVTLESCSSTAVNAALVEIEALDFHAQRPLCLPILARGRRRS